MIYVVASVKRRASINHPRASRGSVGPSGETRATRIDSSDKRAGGKEHGLDNSTVCVCVCVCVCVFFVRLEASRDGGWKEKEREDDTIYLGIDKRRLADCEFRNKFALLPIAAAEEMLRRCLHEIAPRSTCVR